MDREVPVTQPVGRILCPVDFSHFSESALRHALLLARWLSEPVRLLWVQHGSQAPLDGFPPLTTSIHAVPDWRERVLAKLSAFGEPARAAGVEVEVEVEEGEPVPTILRRAREIPAGVVVLGTHGHGGFETLFLGSVTEKVVRKATCPVLAVPRPVAEHDERGVPRVRTVLCPVDFSESSRTALSYAVALCRVSGASLVALHVVEALPVEDFAENDHFNVPEFRAILESDARKGLSELVGSVGIPNRPVREVVVSGKAWRRIVETAREVGAGLVVMGVQGRSVLDRALFGSTTHHVIRAAPCAVLAAHA
ncbi:universal stress protein [Acidobacteria bacterium ACD]|nr:MAG: universal stress protein [Acidobacteriota bacterium]MCE7957413.1 universal stress protein [Acidobacteria bacterium ACB2]MDL1949742.1 universal stress protein [Acidobacteria bacterium ACD]